MVRNSFILFFFLLSCTPYSFKTVKIDKAFQSYYEDYIDLKFYYTGIANTRPINIVFESLIYPRVGTCLYGQKDGWTIKIDPVYWFYTARGVDREILFLHEMGHCDLDRSHTINKSIMEPYLLSNVEYNNDTEYYLRELFLQNSSKSLAIGPDMGYSKSGGNHGEGINHTCGTDRVR